MVQREVEVRIPGGLEARPIAVLVQVASQYESSVYLLKEGKRVNAKSIMGMMTMGLNTGEKITIVADGADEVTALEGIEKYIGSQETQA